MSHQETKAAPLFYLNARVKACANVDGTRVKGVVTRSNASLRTGCTMAWSLVPRAAEAPGTSALGRCLCSGDTPFRSQIGKSGSAVGSAV